MDRKKRIGVIGTGGRGSGFARQIHRRDDAEISCLHDSNPVRMLSLQKELGGGAAACCSLDEMFSQNKPDAVIITTPDCFHEEHSCAALEAGCDVLVDKPLAVTVKGCRNIIDASKSAGSTIMIGFNLRHVLTLKKLKEIVDAGTLGKVFMIENAEFYDGGRTYMSRWNRRYEKSGGLWVHKGSHDFDIFNWLLGFPKPLRVSASAGVNALNPGGIPFQVKDGVEPGPSCSECSYSGICPDYHNRALEGRGPEIWGPEARRHDGYAVDACIYMSDKNVHDNGIALVEYEDGSRASHLECFVCSFSDRTYTVVGDRGVAQASLHRRLITINPRWSGEVITHKIPAVEGGHHGADEALVESFMDVIKGGERDTATAEQGLLATAIGQAAEIAWRENRFVLIEELG